MVLRRRQLITSGYSPLPTWVRRRRPTCPVDGSVRRPLWFKVPFQKSVSQERLPGFVDAKGVFNLEIKVVGVKKTKMVPTEGTHKV